MGYKDIKVELGNMKNEIIKNIHSHGVTTLSVVKEMQDFSVRIGAYERDKELYCSECESIKKDLENTIETLKETITFYEPILTLDELKTILLSHEIFRKIDFTLNHEIPIKNLNTDLETLIYKELVGGKLKIINTQLKKLIKDLTPENIGNIKNTLYTVLTYIQIDTNKIISALPLQNQDIDEIFNINKSLDLEGQIECLTRFDIVPWDKLLTNVFDHLCENFVENYSTVVQRHINAVTWVTPDNQITK